MSQATALEVEDEMIVALDLQTKLERLGYSVPATCDRGEDAVEQVGRLRPDIVLMDINLAGEMDGVEAARQIRERFFVPVVFLTAFSDETTLQRAQQVHPSGYLLKPFQDKELHAQKMEAIGELAAGIAHNFNNMLGSVVGNLELVMMEDLGEAREYLEEAVDSCQEAADIVKQLLALMKPSAWKKPSRYSPNRSR